MRTFLIFTACLYACESYSLGRVIESENSNDSFDTPQEFNHEHSDPQNFLQQLLWNMYQESKMSYPNSYTKVKITNICEHSLDPDICPLCILRIRKTVVMNVPNENVLNYLSIESNFNGTNSTNLNTISNILNDDSATGILNDRDSNKISMPFIVDESISNKSEDNDEFSPRSNNLPVEGKMKISKPDSTTKNEFDKENIINNPKMEVATNISSKNLIPRCINLKKLDRNLNSENNDSDAEYVKDGAIKEIFNNFASFKEMPNPIVLETSKFNISEDVDGINNDRIQIKSLMYPGDSRNNLVLPDFLHKIFSNSWMKQTKDTPIISYKNDSTTIL